MTTRSKAAVRTAAGALCAIAFTTFVCAQTVPPLDWQVRQLGATPRIDHAMAYLDTTRTTYVFGGSDSETSPPSDAFFAFDGVQYRALFPTPRPSARRGHTLIEYPARRCLVLFGGRDANGALLNDTWEWDGTTWTQIATALAPSPREGHATALDHGFDRVVLFGGETSAGVDAQTWAYDGTTWAPVAGTPPPARRDHVMSTVVAVGGGLRTVLFGGNDGPTLLWDTWTFDGIAWTPAILPRPPQGRRDATMVFHSILNAPLLLGGSDANGELADAWQLVPSISWARVPMTTSGLGRRTRHAATFDRSRNLVVVHGGIGTQSVSFSQLFEGRLPGLEGRATSFGRRCTTPTPLAILPFGPGGPLLPGGQAAVSAVAATRVTSSVLLIGLDSTRFGALLLPLDLTPIGMTGCELSASIDATIPGPNPGVTGVVSIRLPNDPSLGGARFFVQALAPDVAANAAGLMTSDALAFHIGFRATSPLPTAIVESFANANQLDADVSSGTWSNFAARFGHLGLDGRHGAFVADDGVPAGANTFVWNTDGFTIPASRTVSGVAETVTDGVFRFTEFVVPADRTVVFVGSRPARIHVRGRVDIRGRVVANGRDLEVHSTREVIGQIGGIAGPGGGVGGRGAYRASGFGTHPLYDGADGASVQLLAGHAYANAQPGTGGRGSLLFPASGLNSAITYNGLSGSASAMIAAGGGGGGYSGPGGLGQALFNNSAIPTDLGPPAPGGTAFPLFPLPPAIGGIQRLEHFLIGGSGGGGGGAHPFFSLRGGLGFWACGSAGTGGGGALALRVGGSLQIASGASIEARGGDGPQTIPAPPPAPGGGGSGGSIVLQVGGTVTQLGQLTVRGGLGGVTNDRLVFNVETRGGNGAPGFARLEVDQPQPPLALIGAVVPPATAGAVDTLTDRDATSGFQSKWYWNDLPVLTRWNAILVETTVGGLPVRFSDQPNLGAQPGPGTPLQLWLQGARFDPATGQLIPGSEGPWRTGVGTSASSLNTDGANAIRFQLVGDRSIGGEVVVQRVTVWHGQP